jgi:hypothetical protein
VPKVDVFAQVCRLLFAHEVGVRGVCSDARGEKPVHDNVGIATYVQCTRKEHQRTLTHGSTLQSVLVAHESGAGEGLTAESVT